MKVGKAYLYWSYCTTNLCNFLKCLTCADLHGHLMISLSSFIDFHNYAWFNDYISVFILLSFYMFSSCLISILLCSTAISWRCCKSHVLYSICIYICISLWIYHPIKYSLFLKEFFSVSITQRKAQSKEYTWKNLV